MAAAERRGREEGEVLVPVGPVGLAGTLSAPERARGLVVFAHGAGSGRFSPRNRQVASALRQAGLGTLLMDLLTEGEERIDRRTGELRFDIELLAARLVAAVDWLGSERVTRALPLGLFGASTGAAAALAAAARRPAAIGAVVSRGGRPDLAEGALDLVRAPTLLVVGGDDAEVLALNERALRRLPHGSSLEVIAGAGHLFEEPGALDRVAQLAAAWFDRHMTSTGRAHGPPRDEGDGR